MRTYIQLRDGIGYATVVTSGEIDHTSTPDHTTAVEVFTDNPEQFLRKQYNAESQTWSDAPIIRFAELNEYGQPMEIRRTVFIHEMPANSVLMPDGVDSSWQYINGEWLPPVIVVSPGPQAMIESPQLIEEQSIEETSSEETVN